jgi:hypothetical protein
MIKVSMITIGSDPLRNDAAEYDFGVSHEERKISNIGI